MRNGSWLTIIICDINVLGIFYWIFGWFAIDSVARNSVPFVVNGWYATRSGRNNWFVAARFMGICLSFFWTGIIMTAAREIDWLLKGKNCHLKSDSVKTNKWDPIVRQILLWINYKWKNRKIKIRERKC